jgi:hypothetical protein
VHKPLGPPTAATPAALLRLTACPETAACREQRVCFGAACILFLTTTRRLLVLRSSVVLVELAARLARLPGYWGGEIEDGISVELGI